MKEIIKRLDAILILIAAIVYKSNADPAGTALIAVCTVFCVGVAIDSMKAVKMMWREKQHKKWREQIEDSDRRFAELLAIMEEFNR